MTDHDRLVEVMAIALQDRSAGFKTHTPANKWARDMALASLTAIEAAGYRVVPVEMTPEMKRAVPNKRIEDGWRDALNAFPKVTPT